MFWGFILIIAGVGWLLQNLDYLTGTFWEIFWPAVVIALGLSMLFGRKSRWSRWCCGPWEHHHNERPGEHHEESHQ